MVLNAPSAPLVTGRSGARCGGAGSLPGEGALHALILVDFTVTLVGLLCWRNGELAVFPRMTFRCGDLAFHFELVVVLPVVHGRNCDRLGRGQAEGGWLEGLGFADDADGGGDAVATDHVRRAGRAGSGAVDYEARAADRRYGPVPGNALDHERTETIPAGCPKLRPRANAARPRALSRPGATRRVLAAGTHYLDRESRGD